MSEAMRTLLNISGALGCQETKGSQSQYFGNHRIICTTADHLKSRTVTLALDPRGFPTMSDPAEPEHPTPTRINSFMH